MQRNIKNVRINQMAPLSELASFSKYVAGEGIVLLKNDNVLPMIDKKIAVFGRIQFNYYKSGTGSGGLVNVRHVPSFIEALLMDPNIKVNQTIYNIYKNWVNEFPFDSGNGQWASEPWHQTEMKLDLNHIKAASNNSDIAVVVFGRTAGEDKDNHATKGSYYLTDDETELLKNVTTNFKQTVVVLNVGNAIDLSFMDTFKVDGLLYAWHGGQYGALALKDIMVGYKSPSGKLPMSLIKRIEDDPSNKNFGHKSQVVYEEDIYVGYRYFETFNQDAVRYPFGYGLTYSKFKIEPISFDMENKDIKFKVKVTNKGKFRAKEVVQVYLEAPQGLLGKPKKVLAGFYKTHELSPGQSVEVTLDINFYNLASYDDVGHIYKSAFVLEKGIYQFYIGASVRDAKPFGVIDLEDDIITQFSKELAAPIKPFKRLKPDQNFKPIYEDTPLRTTNYNEVILNNIPHELPTNDIKISLLDVYEHKYTIDEFIGSLKVDRLIELTRGEGMSSPKVTAGTASAFGGVTDELLDLGIPIACAADGPSGIRMDSGFYASSLPNGILLASTFDLNIVEMLYKLVGKEMKGYQIDLILGPGMNIIRHPLNGRNFEYYSEDPLLTGLIAASAVLGLQSEGVSGTLKHLYGNNQETDRFNVDAVISERAQREIYLKCFEIAIKVGKANAIMTSYNPVNSLWTASQFEINSLLLRDEWGFKGILVTDWWAKMNDFGTDGDVKNTKAMIISQNDLYMVIKDAKSNSNDDNSKISYINGDLKLAHLQRVAKNILSYLLTTPAFYRMHQLDFKYKSKRRSHWFKTNNNALNIPVIDKVQLDGKTIDLNPLTFNNYLEGLEELKTLNAKNATIYPSKDNKFALIKVQNKKDTNIYYVYTHNLDTTSTEIVNIEHLNVSHYHKLGNKAWEPLLLDFKDAYYNPKTINHKDNTLEIVLKDAVLSYPVSLANAGKYLIDFSLSSSANSLAQLPFSVYLNNVYKTTITFNGTEGHKIHARASVLADPGDQIITFKFNKSDIKLHEIKIMRHG